jgi:hypothetical protein
MNEENIEGKPTYNQLEKEIEQLKHRPTIYEVLMMPLKGLPLKECKYYLQTTLDNLENISTVN